jgi:hypothetical protein
MTVEQYSLFPDCEEPSKPKVNKERRNWENGFQRWSDKQHEDEVTPFGKCGYGSMCDYCVDNSYGRPCVRALNKMLREENKAVNYAEDTYDDVWCKGGK